MAPRLCRESAITAFGSHYARAIERSLQEKSHSPFSKTKRSQIMAAVKSKHTTPEVVVRRLVHRMGYRFRLHVKALPGTPDIVLPRLRKIIEVRGCFWHGHRCGRCRIPATRRAYWVAKIDRNRRRGQRTRRAQRRLGWAVLTVWECQLRDASALERRVKRFLGEPSKPTRSSDNR